MLEVLGWYCQRALRKHSQIEDPHSELNCGGESHVTLDEFTTFLDICGRALRSHEPDRIGKRFLRMVEILRMLALDTNAINDPP